MTNSEREKSPIGFRKQLLQLLRNEALRTDIPVERHQQRVAFERLLARLPRNGDWILKGGLALQFRYGLLSRSTRDVDLRIAANPAEGLQQIRTIVAAAANPDFFTFEFGETAQELQGAPGGPLRVKVSARVAGIQLVSFHIDLSSGDALVDEPDQIIGSDFLAFAGIMPVEFPVYPIAQHLAEKLHAYTLPRTQENTRVKDLVDICTFAATERIEATRLGRPCSPAQARTRTCPYCPSSSWCSPEGGGHVAGALQSNLAPWRPVAVPDLRFGGRLAEEAAVIPHPHQDRDGQGLEGQRQGDGIIAGVEDEQRGGRLRCLAAQQRADLRRRHLVRVRARVDAFRWVPL